MSALFILIGCSIPIALGFLIAFLVSAKNGQFDDGYTPSLRMLTDDTPSDTDASQTSTETKPSQNHIV